MTLRQLTLCNEGAGLEDCYERLCLLLVTKAVREAFPPPRSYTTDFSQTTQMHYPTIIKLTALVDKILLVRTLDTLAILIIHRFPANSYKVTV